MKKYFRGFTAIILAIGFSAFTKQHQKIFPFIFAKTTNVVTYPVVENVASYAMGATPPFSCGTTPGEVACEISAYDEYVHFDEDYVPVLNTASNPGGGAHYLTIHPGTIVSGKYNIAYITSDDNGTKGTDFDFRNASTDGQ